MSDIRSKSNRTLVALIFILILGYFSYHAISGERGLLALIKLSNKVEENKKELDATSVERLKLEHKVKLLRDESLDLDLLDEQARRLLGYVGKDETVYSMDKKNDKEEAK